MKVLAVDPGYDRVGLAIIEKKDIERVVFSECFTTDKKDSFSARIFAIGSHIESLIEEHQPEFFAIEQLFFAKNTKTALAVSEARGMMLYIACKHNLKIFEYTPNQIKLAVTGYGAANKQEVHAMVQRLIAIPNNLKTQYKKLKEFCLFSLKVVSQIAC